jgi:hypothetical protein
VGNGAALSTSHPMTDPSQVWQGVRKSPVSRTKHKNRICIMEAERINAIGSLLTDLSTRTLDLRGYL